MKKSFSKSELKMIENNLAVHRIATWIQVACVIAGLISVLFVGPGGLILGFAGAWLFSFAKPGPDPRIDKFLE